MRRVTDRPPPPPPPFAGLQRPFRRRWKIGFILLLAAVAISQFWIWTAKEPRTEPIAAVIDTQSRDPLGIRVRFLFGDDRDQVAFSAASAQGQVRVYIAPDPADQELELPNIAAHGPAVGRPIELPSRGGLTAQLEVRASDADHVSVFVLLEYGDGNNERLALSGSPVALSYDAYLFGKPTETATYAKYVAPPEAHLLLAMECLGLLLIVLIWLGVRMFRDSGVVDKKRHDRRFYSARWRRWLS